MISYMKRNILLVQNNSETFFPASVILKNNGYNVAVACDKKQAINLMSSDDSIELALIDLDPSPGIDGPDTAVEILKVRELPVVFLTSDTGHEMVQKVKGIRRYGYVIKDTGETALLASMEMAFDLFESHAGLDKGEESPSCCNNSRGHTPNGVLKNTECAPESEREYEKLREKEFLFNLITDNMVDLVFIMDSDHHFQYVSPSFEKALGYSCEELIGRDVMEHVHPEDRDIIKDELIMLFHSGSARSEYRYRNRAGDYLWYESNGKVLRNGEGEVTGAVVGSRDITDRIKLFQTLYESEKKYRDLFSSMTNGFVLQKAVSGGGEPPEDLVIADVNPAIEKITGKKIEELKGKSIQELCPDFEDEWLEKGKKTVMTGQGEIFDGYHRSFDKWLRISTYRPLNGYLATIVEDITERKIAEKKLYESEVRYKTLVDKSPLAIFLVRNGKYIYANPSGALRLGYDSPDELKNLEVEKTISPESMKLIVSRIENAGNGNSNPPVELIFMRKDGTTVIAESQSVPVILDDGQAIMVIAKDVTREKQIERKLAEKELQFSTFIESSPIGIYMTNPAGDYIYVNRGWLDMTGRSFEESRGKGWIDGLHPEDRDRVASEWYESVRKGDTWGAEYRFKDPAGMVTWVYCTATPVYNSGDELSGYLGFNIDITDQVIARALLKDGEEKYKTVADYTYDWEFWIGEDGEMKYVSPSCEEISGYSSDEFLSGPELLGDIVYTEDRNSPCINWASINEFPLSNETEFRIKTKQGETKWISHVCRAVYDSRGKFAGRRGSNRDITERKKAEIEIKELLKQKETLLREVHHRVKNNMNTIAGLLKLQSMSISDNTAVQALEDARFRVQSMILIYDKLNSSVDYKNLQVKDYIDNLVADIIKVFPGHERVKVIKDIEDFSLDSKILFTMGVMINELITNAYKHAFEGLREPVLVFSIKKDAGKIIFSVYDNGAGIPEEVKNGERKGFGLNLVSSLAEQLDGKMTITGGKGTNIEIVINL